MQNFGRQIRSIMGDVQVAYCAHSHHAPLALLPCLQAFRAITGLELLSGEWCGMKQSTSFTGYNVDSIYMVLNKDPMKNISAW